MDKIDELIDNIETSLMGCGDEDVEYANRCAKELSVSRAALRAEFDAQAARIDELEARLNMPAASLYGQYNKAQSRIAELESELAALKEERRWIPVADELPEKSQNYLVCSVYPVGVKPFVDLCYYVRKFGFADFGAKITHWMQLPQPPEAE